MNLSLGLVDWTRARWRARWALAAFAAVVLVGSGEGAARVFWRLQGVPLLHPSRILYACYPGLREIDARRPGPGDGFRDILILGGSPLHPGWGTVEHELRRQLDEGGLRDVRLFNLAAPGQTSRDSLVKYAALDSARFDRVVFYHGINEARANSVPPELFRDDYGHLPWYEVVSALAPYHGACWFALPYTLRYMGIRLRQVIHRGRYASPEAPRPEWVRHGRDLRSARCFERNLTAIVETAARRGDRMMLMTFAIYAAQRPVEPDRQDARITFALWGEADSVIAAVNAHNAIVHRVAAERDDVSLLDQANLMEPSPRYFNDPCHFTALGSPLFAKHLADALIASFESEDHVQGVRAGQAPSP
jgi:hypothetical protein